MKFKNLVANIVEVNDVFQGKIVKTINQSLVLRNWLFGFYIVEFEQDGNDYAQYKDRLLYRISDELKLKGLKGGSYTNLTNFRKFYLYYSQFYNFVINLDEKLLNYKQISNLQAMPEDLKKDNLFLSAKDLISKLSFSHFAELVKVDDSKRRLFYEIETIKGNWTYRQLNRQIGSLLYERTALSNNKEELLAQLQQPEMNLKPSDVIREPYVFEFLELKNKEVFSEKNLEDALLNHLQEFLIELGTGFCFEARQKSFLIDNKRHKIDLLFYHRILKCHVLIDLKIREFNYEDAGQMNFYLNYFKDNEMVEGDNQPIGLVLCTSKNETIVQYATGGINANLFISKYKLNLPDEEIIRNFLVKEKLYLEEELNKSTKK